MSKKSPPLMASRVFLIAILASFPICLQSMTLTEQQREEWFYDDSDILAQDVNEGQLEFLVAPLKKAVHHHYNKLTITQQSMLDGWVKLEQCHENLDKVPALQIVFNKQRVRNLKLEKYQNIERAWVKDGNVQLRNIHAKAYLCLSAETRTLVNNQDGTFSMQNGPFMRRFLDGYYPMHVSADINVQTDQLCVAQLTPEKQAGFDVWDAGRNVHYDAWFEGKLYTVMTFFSLPTETSTFSSKIEPVLCDQDDVIASTR